MRRKLTLSGLLLLMSVTGCSNMNNTEKGLLGGTIIGAGLGTAVGIVTRNPAAGAAIGGVTGAAIGGMAGADQDRRDYRDKVAQAQANAVADATRNQMTLNDVVQLSQRGTAEDVIIRQIDATNSVFNLSTSDLNYLQDQGVSRNVIAVMQSRRMRVIYPAPVYGPPPVYGDPYYGPRVSVGIGGRF